MNLWNGAVDILARMSGWGAVTIALVLMILAVGGRWLSPQWRYGLWLLVMARMLLPVVPESNVSIFHLLRMPGQKELSARSLDKIFVGSLPVPVAKTESMEGFALAGEESPAEGQITFSQLAGAIWLAGAVLMLLGLGRGMVTARRMKLRSVGGIPHELMELAQACREQVGISGKVPVCISDRVKSPVLVGVWRPGVVLPLTLVQKWEAGAYSASEMKHVLLHEFMHCKRGDMWAAGLAAAVRCVYWFHPLVWLAVVRLRREQEMACDADVLRVSNGEREKVEYGRTLVRLADEGMSGRWTVGALGIVEKKSQLRRRIEMISKYRNSGWGQTLAGVAMVAVVGATTFTEARAEEAVPEKAAESLTKGKSPESDDAAALPNKLTTSSSDLKTTEIDFSKPGAFRVMVAPKDGELVYTFDENTKDLESISAKKDVSFEVEKFIVKSDEVDVKVESQATSRSLINTMGLAGNYILTAGKGEVILKKHDGKPSGMQVTAGKITYHGANETFVLEGQATVYQKDAQGRVNTTRGDKMSIDLSGKNFKIKVAANTQVRK